MPTGEQFRRLAGAYAVEEDRLRDAAVAIESIGDHAVFDGVMLSTAVEFSAEAAAESCRFTDHGWPADHATPHQHWFRMNSTKLGPVGGVKRGPPEPM